ncbi:MAG TPA: hypothetical protein VFO86_07995, partial [Terriglobia bacterium]|nr:hypothetical protein [Terriglobia bacterium]
MSEPQIKTEAVSVEAQPKETGKQAVRPLVSRIAPAVRPKLETLITREAATPKARPEEVEGFAKKVGFERRDWKSSEGRSTTAAPQAPPPDPGGDIRHPFQTDSLGKADIEKQAEEPPMPKTQVAAEVTPLEAKPKETGKQGVRPLVSPISFAPVKPEVAPKQGTAADPSLLIPNLGPTVIAPVSVSKPTNLVPESASIDTNEKRIPERLNLAEFGVTRFEYKTEIQPHLAAVMPSEQLFELVKPSLPIREIKPAKPISSFESLMQNASAQDEISSRPVMLTRPDELQHVRPVF